MPPKLVIRALGTVPTTGWADGQLEPRPHPVGGIYEFDFTAVPPTGTALEVLMPMAAHCEVCGCTPVKGERPSFGKTTQDQATLEPAHTEVQDRRDSRFGSAPFASSLTVPASINCTIRLPDNARRRHGMPGSNQTKGALSGGHRQGGDRPAGSPGSAVANNFAVERIALDGDAAGFLDQAADLGDR